MSNSGKRMRELSISQEMKMNAVVKKNEEEMTNLQDQIG